MTLSFKDIPGYPGWKASSEGKLWRKVRDKWVEQKGYRDQAGYLRVGLGGMKGKQASIATHRLLAAAFLNLDLFSDDQVNHKDLDKSNNAISNLEVVTPSENCIHAIETNARFRAEMKREVADEPRILLEAILACKELNEMRSSWIFVV